MKVRRALALLLLPLALGTAVSMGPAEDVVLRWKGTVGDVLRYRMTMSQGSKGSATPATEFSSAFVIRQEVKRVSSEGTGTVALSYEAARLSGPGATYDSTSQQVGGGNPQIHALFRPLLAATFELEIGPSGRIRAIRGLEETLEKALEGMDMPGARALLEQSFSRESLRRLVELNVFPEEPLSRGDSWRRETELQLPLGTMRLETENTYQGIEERAGIRCAKIGVEGKLELRSGDPELRIEVTLTDQKISGQMFFRVDKGYLIDSNVIMSLDLGLSAGEAAFDMQLTTTTAMKRIGLDDPFFE